MEQKKCFRKLQMNIENGSIFTVPVIILHTRCIFQKRMQVAKQLFQEPQKQKNKNKNKNCSKSFLFYCGAFIVIFWMYIFPMRHWPLFFNQGLVLEGHFILTEKYWTFNWYLAKLILLVMLMIAPYITDFVTQITI